MILLAYFGIINDSRRQKKTYKDIELMCQKIKL